MRVLRTLLFRQRKVWMPTLIGWLFLLAALIAVGVLVGRNIYSFLAPNAPIHARVLVVEGWLAPEELNQAIQAFQQGGYERVVTTGGPMQNWPEFSRFGNYADMAADYLVRHGIPDNSISVFPAPKSAQDRTFLSAVTLRDASIKTGSSLVAFDLFSSGAHSRRSRLLFQMAFGREIHIGVRAARPADFDPAAWWKTSSGVESIVFQTVALLWVNCCFWPGPAGSQQELWGT